jgi:hypothetical protein
MSFLAGTFCAEAVLAKCGKSDTKMAQSKAGHLVLLLGKPVMFLSGCMTMFFFRGRGVDPCCEQAGVILFLAVGAARAPPCQKSPPSSRSHPTASW